VVAVAIPAVVVEAISKPHDLDEVKVRGEKGALNGAPFFTRPPAAQLRFTAGRFPPVSMRS
jgi:hypothetical protein